MNEKLKFKFSEIVNRQRGPGSVSRGELIIKGVHAEKGNTRSKILRLSLHERAVKKAGWKEGDVINLAYDGGAVCLFRDDSGRTLSKTQGTRFVARFAIPNEYADAFEGKVSGIEVDGGNIAFDILPR